MSDHKKIALVIPSLEPDEKLIRLLHSLEGKIDCQDVIVVNDGSSACCDEIFRQAESMGCKVLKHAVNLGKGRALKTAFNAVLQEDQYEGAVIADSDGQHSADDIVKCMKAMEESPDTLILGSRDFSKENVPRKSRMGNVLTRNIMKVLCGINITDTQTGLRGIPRSFMKKLLCVNGERYEFETNMLLAAKEQGVHIQEIPIETIYIDENKTSHFNPVKDSIRVYAMFGKFLFSSLSSSLIDIVCFSVMVWLLAKKCPETYIVISTIVSRGISSVYNYAMNKVNVFKNNENGHKTVIRYYMLCIVQAALSAGGVSLWHMTWGGNETVIKIIVDMILFFFSFQVQREWVFRREG